MTRDAEISPQTCASCRYWTQIPQDPKPEDGYNPDYSRAYVGFGECGKIIKSAGYGLVDNVDAPNIIVENDEGWGLFTGPHFGCVLWQLRV